MNKNIFENAYFGKPFKTRDGRKAIFVSRNPYRNETYVLIEGNKSADLMQNDGHYWATKGREYKDDIISEWQEPIDEEELDKMADDYHKTCYHYHSDDIVLTNRIEKAFKAGYRKAKTEQQ